MKSHADERTITRGVSGDAKSAGAKSAASQTINQAFTLVVDGLKHLISVIKAPSAAEKLKMAEEKLAATEGRKITSQSTKNGTVTASARVKAGESVTVKVTPDAGYKLSTLTISYLPAGEANYKTEDVRLSGGKYTFVMPDADVTLIAGPVALETPFGVSRQDVRSSGELCAAVGEELAAVVGPGIEGIEEMIAFKGEAAPEAGVNEAAQDRVEVGGAGEGNVVVIGDAVVIVDVDGAEVVAHGENVVVLVNSLDVGVSGIPAAVDIGMVEGLHEVLHILAGDGEILGSHVFCAGVFDEEIDAGALKHGKESADEGEILLIIGCAAVGIGDVGAKARMKDRAGDAEVGAGLDGVFHDLHAEVHVESGAHGIDAGGVGLHEVKAQRFTGAGDLFDAVHPVVTQEQSAGQGVAVEV